MENNNNRKYIKVSFISGSPTPRENDNSQFSFSFDHVEKEIRQVVNSTKQYAVELQVQFDKNVKYNTLLDKIRHKPDILHLMCHGDGAGIYLEDGKQPEYVAYDVLVKFFTKAKADGCGLKCLIFSACESKDFANELSSIVPCVIGTQKPVSDTETANFACGFYKTLAEDMTLKDAFEWGKTLMKSSDKYMYILGKEENLDISLSTIRPPEVFISWAEQPELNANEEAKLTQKGRVNTLAEALLAKAIDCNLEEYFTIENWGKWMEKTLSNSQFVILVCSPTYYKFLREGGPTQDARNMNFQGNTIYSLMRSEQAYKKFIPVVLISKGGEHKDITDQIPLVLRGGSYYTLEFDKDTLDTTQKQFQSLVKRLLNLPETIKPPLGKIR